LKQKIVGTYQAGYYHVQLVLREGVGGESYLVPGDRPVFRIKVGGDVKSFYTIMKVLSHEIWELVLNIEKLRFYPSACLADDTGACFFMLNHAEFSNANACASEYIETARKPLKKAYKNFKKKTKCVHTLV